MTIWTPVPYGERPYGPTFRNETNGARMVHLQSIGRPYGSFTARQKAIWFICGLLEGRMVHFMDHKQDLRPAWSTT